MHAAVLAPAGREARHVPPAAEQASWQLWPSAPRCHGMPSLPHAQSLPGRCGGSGGGDGGEVGDGGGDGGEVGDGGGDGAMSHGQNRWNLFRELAQFRMRGSGFIVEAIL